MGGVGTMSEDGDMMDREPLAIIGAVVALVQALVTTVALMGWVTLTPEQAAGWMGVVALTGTLAVTITGRSKVTPVADPRLPQLEEGAGNV